jgi:hypothetical protein
MPDLYLIAHKVSGSPAFDVATRMECPECQFVEDNRNAKCSECDETGYWWIIPTSGHRAYPYWDIGLGGIPGSFGYKADMMPEGLPDHYTHTASPAETRSKLEALLARLPPAAPLKRRF